MRIYGTKFQAPHFFCFLFLIWLILRLPLSSTVCNSTKCDYPTLKLKENSVIVNALFSKTNVAIGLGIKENGNYMRMLLKWTHLVSKYYIKYILSSWLHLAPIHFYCSNLHNYEDCIIKNKRIIYQSWMVTMFGGYEWSQIHLITARMWCVAITRRREPATDRHAPNHWWPCAFF